MAGTRSMDSESYPRSAYLLHNAQLRPIANNPAMAETSSVRHFWRIGLKCFDFLFHLIIAIDGNATQATGPMQSPILSQLSAVYHSKYSFYPFFYALFQF